MIAAREKIVTAFDRAVHYDAHADVQRRTAAALAERLRALPLPPAPRILEFGCGTGFLAAAAATALNAADWLMTDISRDMLARSRQRFADSACFRFALMDAERPQLPGEERDFDLVCSNLTAQWFEDLERSSRRLLELVRPGGWLVFTLLAEGSFGEWDRAHRALGLRSGLRQLPKLAELAMLRPHGLAGDIAIETLARKHPDARDFVRSLREIGAWPPRPGHRPLGPAAMRAVMRGFEEQGAQATHLVATCSFRRAEGRDGA
jgi:malonyl-CoA O-methyltransferase